MLTAAEQNFQEQFRYTASHFNLSQNGSAAM